MSNANSLFLIVIKLKAKHKIRAPAILLYRTVTLNLRQRSLVDTGLRFYCGKWRKSHGHRRFEPNYSWIQSPHSALPLYCRPVLNQVSRTNIITFLRSVFVVTPISHAPWFTRWICSRKFLQQYYTFLVSAMRAVCSLHLNLFYLCSETVLSRSHEVLRSQIVAIPHSVHRS